MEVEQRQTKPSGQKMERVLWKTLLVVCCKWIGILTLHRDHEVPELYFNGLWFEQETIIGLIDLRISALDRIESRFCTQRLRPQISTTCKGLMSSTYPQIRTTVSLRQFSQTLHVLFPLVSLPAGPFLSHDP